MRQTARGPVGTDAGRSAITAAARGTVTMGRAVTGSRDPLYDVAYVDVDEWRDEPHRYRYVHGGFEGTDARFSFYFPVPSATRDGSSIP